MKLYIAVTADEYELPIDFDESPTQLAKRFGKSINWLYVSIYQRNKLGKFRPSKNGFRFYSVEIENDIDGEEKQ